MGEVAFTLLDRNNQRSSHSVRGVALTAANFDAQVGLVGTLQTALDNLTLCAIDKKSINTPTDYQASLPASNYAIRETKLLIRYKDNVTGTIYTVEIAGPDLANLDYAENSEFIVLADTGIMAAYVTAFEAYVKDADTGINAVTILSAQKVGRNI